MRPQPLFPSQEVHEWLSIAASDLRIAQFHAETLGSALTPEAVIDRRSVFPSGESCL